MPRDIVVTPLTASLAARVDGIDLSADLPDATAQQIREAFWEHSVLVFPDPAGRAGLPEQTRVAALFGEPTDLPARMFLGQKTYYTALDPRLTQGKRPEQMVASAPSRAEAVRRAGEFDGWHTDDSFTPELPRVGTLRCEVIPPVGGDTVWTSLRAAYDALSPIWKEWLPALTALHTVPPRYKTSIDIWSYGPDAEERFDAQYPPREQPVVIAHPETGRPSLFVNPGYVSEICGMTAHESAHLLRFLYGHVTESRFTYRHHWSPGDIVLWDELTCLHIAPVDYAPHDRKTVRVTGGLAAPQAFRANGTRGHRDEEAIP